jgi:hypothetical protein
LFVYFYFQIDNKTLAINDLTNFITELLGNLHLLRVGSIKTMVKNLKSNPKTENSEKKRKKSKKKKDENQNSNSGSGSGSDCGSRSSNDSDNDSNTSSTNSDTESDANAEEELVHVEVKKRQSNLNQLLDKLFKFVFFVVVVEIKVEDTFINEIYLSIPSYSSINNDFLINAITSHLITNFNTVVIGKTSASINKVKKSTRLS